MRGCYSAAVRHMPVMTITMITTPSRGGVVVHRI